MIIARPEPTRTCIVTRVQRPKRELIRIVRTLDGDVCCDGTGRLDGRGAYISMDDASVQKALARGILSKHLKVAIDSDRFVSLMKQVERVRRARLAGDAG